MKYDMRLRFGSWQITPNVLVPLEWEDLESEIMLGRIDY